jgi:pantoate--beta-alanine ligase
LSSRNAYLDAAQRAAAPTLHRALEVMRAELQGGASKERARSAATSTLASMAVVDYFDAVDATTFEPVEALERDALVIGAARFGRTRLIDNLSVSTNGSG